MQHLDEGTIHSWLDGALSAEEAARVEAHVKECARCQAAVAEARGFIAGSSRILTALDNAPRGVIPAARPKRRHRMTTWVSGLRSTDPLWRVAAAVLVVAGGTLLVVRNQGARQPGPLGSRTTAAAAQQQLKSNATQPTTMDAATPASPKVEKANVPLQRRSTSSGAVGDQASAVESRGRETAAPVAASVAPPAAGVAVSSPRFEATAKRANRVEANDLATELPTVRVVDVRQQVGQRITFYEVARGDTVQLAESLGDLNQVMATGMSVTRAAAGSAAATERSRAPAAKPAAVERPTAGLTAAAAPAATPAAQAVFLASPVGDNTLTWTDPATGRVSKLSGRHSRAELEEIRRSIERARAAAADSVKKE
jgi:hypothetical protein